ncbi:SIR2 family NAD-dependent protein deacylase [Panacagrimonas sp.]|uniref:SIR2 family NAD-dependent protein deacylase n=1 Tax=Panacagrimonas sp. TaxID=2480088 RepID=UPI003B5209D1
METIRLDDHARVVFFTGAGLSAESGVPTYRGRGGVWSQYRWEEYACQRAFDADPAKVLDFHELRRARVLSCSPHEGHRHLAAWQIRHPNLHVITQNIDGLMQMAGIQVSAELHGSLWRVRCQRHGVSEDLGGAPYLNRRCPQCDSWLRPDITWFEDPVSGRVFDHATELASRADLFVSVGTSGVVWPAASIPERARRNGARMVEINPESNEASRLYDTCIRDSAAHAIPRVFPLGPSIGANPAAV